MFRSRSADRPGRSGRAALRSPLAVATAVAVVALLVTAAASWSAWHTDRNTERRLLHVQSREAASVLRAAIDNIVDPLQTALILQQAGGTDESAVDGFLGGYAAPGALFATASVWHIVIGAPSRVTSVGAAPAWPVDSASLRAYLVRATTSHTFLVQSVRDGSLQRIAYAMADPAAPGYVVYAERPIPANRRVPVESTSAFAGLHFATYLGPTTSMAALATTDVAPQQLPLAGTTDRQTVPFGDTVLTLVTSPAGHLGGTLSHRLPWIFLAGGVVLSVLGAVIAGQLTRRRRTAERDAATIQQLYGELDELYAAQRTVSLTLQHALLPRTNPSIPSLEIASRYLPGERGAEIGGDWYSLVPVDATHFGFVVGDVSGHGIDAATIMARIRFTLRAFLMEGHPPDTALAMASRHLDILDDGHLATALVGVGDVTTGQITLANAGHLNPLLVAGGTAQFVATAVGLPLGVQQTSYETATVTMPPGSMLLAFTDGLVERRGDDLDSGLDRLAAAAGGATGSVDDVLTAVSMAMADEGGEDDVAILAFRWSASGGASASALGTDVGAVRSRRQ